MYWYFMHTKIPTNREKIILKLFYTIYYYVLFLLVFIALLDLPLDLVPILVHNSLGLIRLDFV